MAGDRPVKTFNCGSCSAPITIRGLGQTTTVACGSCGSIIDISNESYQVLQQAQRRTIEPLIPLGARGKLDETIWEVIGYMIRTDGTGIYSWDEYLLFNPYKGFRWLMNYQGHWTFIRPVKEALEIKSTLIQKDSGSNEYVEFDGERFRLFLTGFAKVKYVLGEFYWQVKIGDEVVVKDFIDPPRILSMERDSSETIWSLGEYMQPDDVALAFRLQGRMPMQSGVGAAQPHPAQGYSRDVKLLGVLFALAMIVVQLLFRAGASNELVAERYYNFSFLDSVKTVVSDPFVLPSFGNLEVSVHAPVNNNWLSLDMDLIDEKGSVVQGGELEVGYYHGVDSDGSWSEGSQRSRMLFAQVPRGIYRLSFEPSVGPGLGQISYQMRLTRDVPYHGNFWLAFLVIVSIPLLLWFWELSFEARRWQEADP